MRAVFAAALEHHKERKTPQSRHINMGAIDLRECDGAPAAGRNSVLFDAALEESGESGGRRRRTEERPFPPVRHSAQIKGVRQ